MSQSIPVEIPSDEEENEARSPFNSHSNSNKKRRSDKEGNIPPPVLVLDDDPTPQKPKFKHTLTASSSSFVPETPMSSDLFNSSVCIVKCTARFSDTNPRSSSADEKISGINGLICLESDKESESGLERENYDVNDTMDGVVSAAVRWSEMSTKFLDPASSHGASNSVQISGDSPILGDCTFEDAIHQIDSDHDKENVTLERVDNAAKRKGKNVEVNAEKKKSKDELMARKMQMREEKKLKREQEKLQKQALKAEAVELKKLEKEKQKWENGKFALKSIVAEIDAKVVELGSIGGHLLTRFSEKGLTFRITSNPIERSIVWRMAVPEPISQLSSKGSEVPYVLLVYEADEFCNLVINESLMDQVSRVKDFYPSYTICYITNKLMAYINKRDQEKYKNPSNDDGWRHPPVEEVLSKLTTHFVRVHSRQCRDEAELAEHVVGLTCGLATCQFRKKLTRLSVNANGSFISKDFIDKNLIKKNVW
ncbi:crossover junction endonuclease EME1B-like [Telopea speciosissima]|uniref:crossover junction endonuclease EME1B-like n=1 Tax=Telopea speciosissima TaxID=54955 RepID=UPI001CC392DA|nr:crossover junction endonuclease EME1B-like [Telopea speciosissima]